MKKTRFTALAIVLIMCLSVLSGCVNVAKAGAIDGEPLPMGVYKMFLMQSISDILTQNAGITTFDDFKNLDVDGKKAIDAAIDMAYDVAAEFGVYIKLFDENGLEFDSASKQSARDTLNSMKANLGGEMAFQSDLKRIGVSEADLLVYYEMCVKIYRVNEVLAGEWTKEYEDDDSAIKEIFDRDFVRVKHILFKIVDDNQAPLSEEEQDEKKKQAEETLEKILDGEDFEDFLDLSEDGMPHDAGYTFTYNEMVASFELASFALKVGEVAPSPVESQFGFHLIKRYDPYEKEEYYESSKSKIINSILNEKGAEYIESRKPEIVIERSGKVNSIDIRPLAGSLS